VGQAEPRASPLYRMSKYCVLDMCHIHTYIHMHVRLHGYDSWKTACADPLDFCRFCVNRESSREDINVSFNK
jgi:hypothetical protein